MAHFFTARIFSPLTLLLILFLLVGCNGEDRKLEKALLENQRLSEQLAKAESSSLDLQQQLQNLSLENSNLREENNRNVKTIDNLKNQVKLYRDLLKENIPTLDLNEIDEQQSSDTVETEEYLVKEGDSLWSIAKDNGCKIEKIKELNDLEGNRIRIGQKLLIPIKNQ